jgi:hypothetical protein
LYGVFVWGRRALDNQKRRLPAWAVTRREKLPEHEPPAVVVMKLLPFQKESLGWMKQQEDSAIRCGSAAFCRVSPPLTRSIPDL